MADKKITPPENILNLPECISCFANIENHANGVFGLIEVKSAESIERHDREFTEHLERREKRDNRNSNYNLLILSLFASVIAYSYLRQNQLESELGFKADRTEIVSKSEFELITQQGDDYNKNIFIKKLDISSDTFTYPSSKRRLFDGSARGAKQAFDKTIRDQKQ